MNLKILSKSIDIVILVDGRSLSLLEEELFVLAASPLDGALMSVVPSFPLAWLAVLGSFCVPLVWFWSQRSLWEALLSSGGMCPCSITAWALGTPVASGLTTVSSPFFAGES